MSNRPSYMSRWKHALAVGLSLLLLLGTSQAATPSRAQIEQFMSLPPAQQQAMASQYGVDINSLRGFGGSAQPWVEPNVVNPRRSNSFGQDPYAQMGQVPLQQDPLTQALNAIDNSPKPFGYDLFAGEPSTFAPVTDIPIPANYVLGPGDSLDIQLFGKYNEQYELRVNRVGSINIPQIGPMKIAGLAFEDARDAIATRLEKRLIGAKSSITLGELRSIRIFVLGDAYKPGSYSVSSLSTMTHALFVSGGISDIGSLRNIQLKRSGKVVAVLDLYDLLINGDTSGDVRLQPGDVVFIPPVGKTVTVDGRVRRPAIYELVGNETVSDAMRMAGGLLPSAFADATVIERRSFDGTTAILGADLSSAEQASQVIRAGDRLVVRSAVEQQVGHVELKGAVSRPGSYPWRTGLRVSDLISNLRADISPEADLQYAVIVRERGSRQATVVLQFSIAEALVTRGTASDPLLNPNDRILVFDLSHDRMLTNGRVRLEHLLTLGTFQAQSRLNRMLGIEAKPKNVPDSPEQQNGSSEGDDSAKEPAIGSSLMQSRKSSFTNGGDFSGIKWTAESYARALELLAMNPEPPLSDYLAKVQYSRLFLLAPVVQQIFQQAGSGAPLQLVEVDGAVKSPGIYPLPVNGTTRELILAGGGLRDSAYTLSAELNRYNLGDQQGLDVEHLRLNLSNVMAEELGSNVVLQSRDKLLVLTTPDWQEENRITLMGEVRFPGNYVIRKGETLLDVLERAGGLTQFANPKGAVYTRESLKVKEREQLERVATDLRREIASSSMRTQAGAGQMANPSEITKLLDEMAKVDPVGRMVINLPLILAGDYYSDVKLEGGDALVIPPQRSTVTVLGEVQYGTTHQLQEGLTVDDYIARSGGTRQRADEDRIYIIKADGSVEMPRRSKWFVSRHQQLEPGDSIVVPLDTEYTSTITAWTNVTQILYQAGVAVAAISNIK